MAVKHGCFIAEVNITLLENKSARSSDCVWQVLGSIHTELLAIELAQADIVKNKHSTHFFSIADAKSSRWTGLYLEMELLGARDDALEDAGFDWHVKEAGDLEELSAQLRSVLHLVVVEDEERDAGLQEALVGVRPFLGVTHRETLPLLTCVRYKRYK